MIEVSKLLLLVLGELLLLSVVYAGIVNFLALSKRRRERSAIKKLVARIKEDSDRREAETRAIMKERFGLTDEKLDKAVHKIAREEKAFYQTLIDVFLRRDTEAVQNLSVDYESSVDAYRTIEIPDRAEPAKDGEESDDRSEELILLKAENQRLTDELQLTMNTMGNMLSEYTQMFAGGADVSLDREKMREIIAPVADESGDSMPTMVEEDTDLADALALQDSDQESDDEGAGVAAEEISADDNDLKALDEELGMLDLSAEGLAKDDHKPAIDLDETVVVSLDQDTVPTDEIIDLDDEVVNLDDVLDDPDTKNS